MNDRSDPFGERAGARREGRSRWRSLLFVPGDSTALLEKAPRSAADALIFDLEDAVPDSRKGQARANLAAFAPRLGRAGADLVVRVNNDPAQLKLDVSSIPAETRAVVLPKTETIEDLLALHGDDHGAVRVHRGAERAVYSKPES